MVIIIIGKSRDGMGYAYAAIGIVGPLYAHQGGHVDDHAGQAHVVSMVTCRGVAAGPEKGPGGRFPVCQGKSREPENLQLSHAWV
jgi:hypothetical protein